MSGTITEDYVPEGRSMAAEGLRDDDRESLAEWRSSEHVDNGSPSTSPPFWDTDEDDDDYGPKPCELFGRHTWKIENFSKEKKREMKSDQFEAGGYKWYILVYPQGCDVPNHLSLFLCVANHDKLLPGWSHFAQFTIAVVNVEPKKIKYSDTLHRFWKKEHDWGWKKFMELSKIQDGFLVDDALCIRAQVQVIREKVDRPFRCLDRPYRRELLRVYMANIEQIYRRFVEDRRSKLTKLIEDKARWSSFQAFWLELDLSTRYRMSREKTEAILKVVVKHFFVEKEVTSTLVMDSLNTGYKSLLYQSRVNKGKSVLVDLEDLPSPMIHLDKDMFVLAGDVMSLLERAALETLPCQPVSLKDEKSSQSRTKDGVSGEEHSNSSIEREERRLTELGRKILEIFVLSHIFSGIEIAYQEAVALRRQEELIREEEAAGLFENETKGKRGTIEKDKRSKKKQAKQKKNNRKLKEKERDEKTDANILERFRDESSIDDTDDLPKHPEPALKCDSVECVSDTSENGDTLIELHQHDLSEESSDLVNLIENGAPNADAVRKENYLNGDSWTCSADSVVPAANTAPVKVNSVNNKSQISPNRTKNQRNKVTEQNGVTQGGSNLSANNGTSNESGSNNSLCGTAPRNEPEVEEKHQWFEQTSGQKKHTVSLAKKINTKDNVELAAPSRYKLAWSSSVLSGPLEKPRNATKRLDQPVESPGAATFGVTNQSPSISTASASVQVPTTSVDPKLPLAAPALRKQEATPAKEQSTWPPVDNAAKLPSDMVQALSLSNSEALQRTAAKLTSTASQPTAVSRPSSAPLVPLPVTTLPAVAEVQVPPLLPRSVSVNESNRHGNDASPSCSAPSYIIPQSYRNAMMGKTSSGVNYAGILSEAASMGQGVSFVQPMPAYTASASMFTASTSEREHFSVKPRTMAGPGKQEAFNNWNPWKDDSYQPLSNFDCSRQQWREDSYEQRTNGNAERSGRFEGLRYRQFLPDTAPALSLHQTHMQPSQGTVGDEFPHLDIINDLLEEEQCSTSSVDNHYRGYRSFEVPSPFQDKITELDVSSAGTSGRFNAAEQLYDQSVLRAYSAMNNPAREQRDGSFSPLHLPNYVSQGRAVSKPWMPVFANASLNSGTLANGFSHPLGDYANLTSRINGDSLYRRANGHW